MKLAVRMLLAGTMLAGVALAGALWTNTQDTSAGLVATEYSIEVNVPASSTGSATFVAVASVNHTVTGGYQAAQWFVDYDEAVVDMDGPATCSAASCTNITKVAAAPTQCTSKADNGVRTLLGCLDLGGPNMTYSGDVWNMTFRCIANGSASFDLGTLNTNSYVRIGAVNQPAHLHTDSITCSGVTGGGPTNTPTATETPGGPTNTPTSTPTTGTAPTNTPTTTGGGGATNTPTTRARTATPTNTAVSDETPGVVETPAPGGTTAPPPPPGATATRAGGGAGGGNIRPPSTGDGSGSGGSDMMWLWMALGAAGVATAAGGAGLLGLQKRKGN